MTTEKEEVVETQPAPTELDALRSELEQQLEQTKGERDAAIEESKKHQVSLNKKAQEVARKEALDEKVVALDAKLDVMATMMGDILDKGEFEGEEKPRKRRSEEYLTRLSEVSKTSKQQGQEAVQTSYQQRAVEADALARVAGLKMDESPELNKAYIHFLKGEADIGLEETRRVVEGRKTEAKPPVLSDEEKEEIARQVAEKKGNLRTETGGPSASSGTFQDTEADYNAGKVSIEEYTEARKKRGLF